VAPQILVAGIGNIFCTDDGFGPAVVAQLLNAVPADQSAGSARHVRVADYGIRGMHLAYDLLDPPDVLILIDAIPDRGEPGQISVLQIEPDHVPAGAADGGQLDAHGMDPATLLGNLVSLGGHLPETTLLVGCQVSSIGEGIGLTPQVSAAVLPGAQRVIGLVREFCQPDRTALVNEVI
jgi:hydrogenase maturation protease